MEVVVPVMPYSLGKIVARGSVYVYPATRTGCTWSCGTYRNYGFATVAHGGMVGAGTGTRKGEVGIRIIAGGGSPWHWLVPALRLDPCEKEMYQSLCMPSNVDTDTEPAVGGR